MPEAHPAANHVFDGGDMDCGSGLILLIRQNMERVPAGGVLEIRSTEPTVTVELPPWCRMTGHEYLHTREESPGLWRHFVRRGADIAAQTAALESDKRQAQDYEWRVRARLTGRQEATVFARNLSWKLGQPVSFEEKDEHPSTIEALSGALAAELMNGFATACTQRGLPVDELESTAKVRLHSVLAHLGLAGGDPAIASVEVTVFVTSPASGEELRAAFAGVVKRAPFCATLHKAAEVVTRLVIL